MENNLNCEGVLNSLQPQIDLNIEQYCFYFIEPSQLLASFVSVVCHITGAKAPASTATAANAAAASCVLCFAFM